jgi:Ni/Co efflux regulator RcnB
MRLKILFTAAALSALPVLTTPAMARDRDWRDDRRVEVFERDGCSVEREYRGRGRYTETVDCSRRNRWGDRDHRRWSRDDDDDRDERRWSSGGWSDRSFDERRYLGAFFGDDHRRVVSRYYGRDCHPYRSDFRRPYRIGDAFPRGYRSRPISHDLYRLLPAPPRGYGYVQYDSDVLLIREATRLVVDAILLSGERRGRW